MPDDLDTPAAPESLPKYLADGLPKQDMATLADARDYIEQLLEYRRQPVDVDDLPEDADPVDDDPETKGTLVTERVKCGSDCTCNDGRGHGPYLYLYKRVDGRVTSEYVGKPSDS